MAATHSPWSNRLRSGLALVMAFAVCFAAARAGSAFTTPNIEPWYRALAKPPLNPPEWVFPVVWSILFAMMAFSLWRVVERIQNRYAKEMALLPFAVQLALNVGWSWAFFGQRSPQLGLMVIVPLLAAILWTIVTFRRTDVWAARLLVPYAAWVGFATYLNLAIWWLNPAG